VFLVVLKSKCCIRICAVEAQVLCVPDWHAIETLVDGTKEDLNVYVLFVAGFVIVIILCPNCWEPLLVSVAAIMFLRITVCKDCSGVSKKFFYFFSTRTSSPGTCP
jgi:hypothetical protein